MEHIRAGACSTVYHVYVPFCLCPEGTTTLLGPRTVRHVSLYAGQLLPCTGRQQAVEALLTTQLTRLLTGSAMVVVPVLITLLLTLILVLALLSHTLLPLCVVGHAVKVVVPCTNHQQARVRPSRMRQRPHHVVMIDGVLYVNKYPMPDLPECCLPESAGAVVDHSIGPTAPYEDYLASEVVMTFTINSHADWKLAVKMLRALVAAGKAHKAGVYMIVNNITGEKYVGSSVDLLVRLLNYGQPSWLNKPTNNQPIWDALNSQPYPGFTLHILQTTPLKYAPMFLETHWGLLLRPSLPVAAWPDSNLIRNCAKWGLPNEYAAPILKVWKQLRDLRG